MTPELKLQMTEQNRKLLADWALSELANQTRNAGIHWHGRVEEWHLRYVLALLDDAADTAREVIRLHDALVAWRDEVQRAHDDADALEKFERAIHIAGPYFSGEILRRIDGILTPGETTK